MGQYKSKISRSISPSISPSISSFVINRHTVNSTIINHVDIITGESPEKDEILILYDRTCMTTYESIHDMLINYFEQKNNFISVWSKKTSMTEPNFMIYLD